MVNPNTQINLKTHLTQLSELHAPSGYETPVRELLQQTWQPLVDSFEVGKLGSLVATKHGKQGSGSARRIMLCAHMDEIGMIVHGIDRGFLRVSRLGGIDARTLPGLPVIVHSREPLRGVVGLQPAHTLKEAEHAHYADLKHLVIDVGLSAEQVAEQVRVGDIVTLDLPVLALAGDRLAGKAFDDRACIAVITVCLEALQSRQHSWDVLAVASVQEEVGSFGARTEAFRLNPDIAIALDVTFGTQPGVDSDAFKLGDGPPISLGANFHPMLFTAIEAAAARLEMTLQHDPIPMFSGTDAWPIQTSQNGIPTALLNIPIRNMHSTVETVDLRDITRAGRLLAEFIAGLDDNFLSTIVWDG